MLGQIFYAQAAINGGLGIAATAAAKAAADALVSAMSVPPPLNRRLLILRTIAQLMAAGVWSKLDALYMMAAHDSQAALLNWRAPGTWTLVPTNSPAFSVDQGYKGDGATSYLQASGYNPSTAGGNFSLNSAVFGLWIQQGATIGGSRLLSMSSVSLFGPVANLAAFSTRLNDVSSANASPNDTTPTHWAVRRLTSTGRDVWEAGAQHTPTDGSVSSAVGTNFFLLSSPTPNSFSDARLAAAYTAAGLSDSDMVAMDACLRPYMKVVGVAP